MSEALDLARDFWRRGRVAVLRTPGLLLLSLLIGVTLWVSVTDTENPIRVDVLPGTIPVDSVNVGASLAVANTLRSVQVRAAAPEHRWAGLTPANFRAFVDLKGLDGREQRVPVNVDVHGIRGVRVVEAIPASVIVNLEPRVSREVPVVVSPVGTVPLGYEVSEMRPEVPAVTVTGPESLVELVRDAVAYVNVAALTVGLVQTVEMTPRGAGGGELVGVSLDPPSLRVDVGVSKSTLTRVLPLEVAISGEPAEGYRVTRVRVTPSTLRVEGVFEVLQGLDALSLPTIDIAGQDATLLRTLAVSLPEGVSAPDQAGGETAVSATVTVSIEPAHGSLRVSVAPQVAGLAQGLVARFDVGAVEVLLAGPLPALNALGPGDVRVTVDVAGAEPGTAIRTVEVQVPGTLTVEGVNPETLSVTLEAR